MERVWVLQEALLSNTIHFVRLGNVPEDQSTCEGIVNPLRFGMNLQLLLLHWSSYGNDGSRRKQETQALEFVHAFLNYGTVTRVPETVHHVQSSNINGDYLSHLNSTRGTGKARDFILAIMPQYPWYKVPQNAKAITFGQLFVDCCRQAQQANVLHAPLLTATYPSQRVGQLQPTPNIPLPKCLGDFVKLLNGPVFHGLTPAASLELGYPVSVRQTGLKADAIIQIIKESMVCSGYLWRRANDGELYPYVDNPKWFREMPKRFNIAQWLDAAPKVINDDIDDQIRHVAKVLNLLHDISGVNPGYRRHPVRLAIWKKIRKWLLKDASSSFIDTLLQLTALVSCGLGISAFQWSKQNLTAVIVHFRNRDLLALIPKDVAENHSFETLKFHLARANEIRDTVERFVLVSTHPISSTGLYPQRVDFTEQPNPESGTRSLGCVTL